MIAAFVSGFLLAGHAAAWLLGVGAFGLLALVVLNWIISR